MFDINVALLRITQSSIRIEHLGSMLNSENMESVGAQQQIWTMSAALLWRSGAQGKIAEAALQKTNGKWSCKAPRFGPGLCLQHNELLQCPVKFC